MTDDGSSSDSAASTSGATAVRSTGNGEEAARALAKQASEAAQRQRLARDLRPGLEAAAALGGDVEAAVIADSWRKLLLITPEPGGASLSMRMWSMSKVVTMVALLRQLGWGERPGQPLPAEVEEALRGAIIRSENCRQRRVVLELQRLAGGAEAARAELAAVFRASGARAQIATQSEAPEQICVPFLEAQTEIAEPLAPALLLGTSTWRIGDAALLMHAIATDRFGAAVSDRVLALMREPKGVSREVPPEELTAPLDWGAGRAFAGLDPAYKAGWGGVLIGDFLAAQIALVRLPSGERLALAVAFHPDEQPGRDDPGITAAPEAIELVMGTLWSLPPASG